MAIKSGFDANSAGLFTDLNQLQQLKGQAKTDQQAALKGVAQEFEQLFMNMMLKSMRQASDVLATDSPFNSGDVKFYQEMYDQQMTLDLSKKGSIGLADIIVKQLSQKVDAVARAESDDDDQDARSLTEQMLNRALASGPVSQPAGMLYRAPSIDSTDAELAIEPKPEADDSIPAAAAAEPDDGLPARF